MKQLSSEPVLWALGLLIILVCAFGGGSRLDIAELAWLRSGTALILAYAVWGFRRQNWRDASHPLILILLLAAIMIAQLVPLPVSVWSSLPGRQIIAELDQLAGLGDVWRPITLSPSATWNSVGSLIVPLTALVLMARLSEQARSILPLGIVAIGCLSAGLGLLQILLGAPDSLYFYEVTTNGSAVGLFANRNHNGVLVAISLLIVLWRLSDGKDKGGLIRSMMATALVLFLLAGVLVNSSRAGLLCTLLSVGLVAFVRILTVTRNSDASKSKVRQMAPLWGGSILVFATTAMFVAGERSAAAERLLGQDPTGGLRWNTIPTTLQIAMDNLFFGVGFGAFEWAYRTVEPRELLGPHYFNEAHNDWLQLIIEGGIPALVVAALTILMLVRGAMRRTTAEDRDLRVLAILVAIILAVGSVVDYPLRTPLMMVVGAWVLFTLGRAPNSTDRPVA